MMYGIETRLRTILHVLAAMLLLGAVAIAQMATNTHAPAVAISSLSPALAAPGSSTLITGSSFTGATQVSFGGQPAVFQVDSATQITAIVPLAATTGMVEVTTPSGTAASSQPFAVIAKTWDAVQNFSTASNPAGAWSYGWAPALDGTFSLLSTNQDCPDASTACWQNGLKFPDQAFLAKSLSPFSTIYTTVIVPGNVLYFGAQGNAVIARWTAPSAGDYLITGYFQGIDTRLAPLSVAILENGATSLFTDTFTYYGQTKNFALKTSLAAGTTIDFEVAYTDDDSNDNVGVAADINLLQ